MYIELSSRVNLTWIDYFDPKLKKKHISVVNILNIVLNTCTCKEWKTIIFFPPLIVNSVSHLIVGGIFNVLLLENQSTACWHGGQIRPVQTLLRDVQNWFWTVQNHVLVSLPLGFWPKGRTPSPQDIQGEFWLKTRCKFKDIFLNQL